MTPAPDEALRLSYADHVLVHAISSLLADPEWCDKDEMLQSILHDVLPDVTAENPALTAWIALGWKVVGLPADRLRALRLDRTKLLRDHHMRRMAAAWDQIREQYPHADR